MAILFPGVGNWARRSPHSYSQVHRSWCLDNAIFFSFVFVFIIVGNLPTDAVFFFFELVRFIEHVMELGISLAVGIPFVARMRHEGSYNLFWLHMRSYVPRYQRLSIIASCLPP